MILCPAKTRVSVLRNVQTGSEAYPLSYVIVPGFFLRA